MAQSKMAHSSDSTLCCMGCWVIVHCKVCISKIQIKCAIWDTIYNSPLNLTHQDPIRLHNDFCTVLQLRGALLKRYLIPRLRKTG